MTDFEFMGEEEPANQWELGTLYAKSAIWLENNTNIFVDPSEEITGIYDDLPLAIHGPLYQIEIPAEVLHKVITHSAEFFDSDDKISLIYSIPHYVEMTNTDEDLQYQKGMFLFSVEKQSEPIYDACIIIKDDEHEDEWAVYKDVDASRETMEELAEYKGTLPFIDPGYFEGDRITKFNLPRQEFSIISAIVYNLDEINAILISEEPPLFLSSE